MAIRVPPLTPPRATPWPVLALRLTAPLLGLLAAACWLWASSQPLLLDSLRGPAHDLHWWSGLTLAGGAAVTLLIWFAGAVGGRLGLLTLLGLLLVMIGGAVLFALWLAPAPNPIHPLSGAVPYAVAGFVSAGVGSLSALAAIVLSGRRRPAGETTRAGPAAPPGSRSRILAAGVAIAIVAVGALTVLDRKDAYLLDVNEYRTVGDLDQDTSLQPSELIGGDRWRREVPGLARARPMVTDRGVVLAAGQNVLLLDRGTGALRWSYTRSDIAGSAAVTTTDDGRHVLAWWGRGPVYVLDARTGERVGHWSWAKGGSGIIEPSLPLVARVGLDGRTSLTRVDLSGSSLWSYPLGECESARARSTTTVVVAVVTSSCGQASTRLVGLSPQTGALIWTSALVGELYAEADGAVLVVTQPAGPSGSPGADAGTLTAVDLRDGRPRWSRELPRPAGDRICQAPQIEAGGHFVEVVCEVELIDALMNASYLSTVDVYDARTGKSVWGRSNRDALTDVNTVTDDGQVLVVRGDWGRGCVLLVELPRERAREVAIRPGAIHECSPFSVVADAGQVLLADPEQETLRLLR